MNHIGTLADKMIIAAENLFKSRKRKHPNKRRISYWRNRHEKLCKQYDEAFDKKFGDRISRTVYNK